MTRNACGESWTRNNFPEWDFPIGQLPNSRTPAIHGLPKTEKVIHTAISSNQRWYHTARSKCRTSKTQIAAAAFGFVTPAAIFSTSYNSPNSGRKVEKETSPGKLVSGRFAGRWKSSDAVNPFSSGLNRVKSRREAIETSRRSATFN